MSIIKLYTDDTYLHKEGDEPIEGVKAMGLVGCLLAFIWDKKHNRIKYAWHISGMDLATLINDEGGSCFDIMMRQMDNGNNWNGCIDRLEYFFNQVDDNSKIYVIGPNCDEKAIALFSGCYKHYKDDCVINTSMPERFNICCSMTRPGPIDVTITEPF